MQRVNRSTAVATLPAAPAGGAPGYFTGGNPGAGQPATVAGFEWFNAVQEEMMELITRSGLTPSSGDLAQVRKSLDRLFGNAERGVTSNTTLTGDDAGIVFANASAGPIVITLPAANVLAGRPVRFYIKKVDSSANAVTVQVAGADTIEGAATYVIPGGNHLTQGALGGLQLQSNGAATWLIVNGTIASTALAGITRFATAAETDAGALQNVAVTPAGLGISTRNYASAGYARLPGGLIIQWGGFITSLSADLTVTFPIAFPNNCFCGHNSVNANTAVAVGTNGNPASTHFQAAGYDEVGRQAISSFYIAIGR